MILLCVLMPAIMMPAIMMLSCTTSARQADAKLAIEGDEQWEKVEKALSAPRTPNSAASTRSASASPESPHGAASGTDGDGNHGDGGGEGGLPEPGGGERNNQRNPAVLAQQEAMQKATELRLAEAEERKKVLLSPAGIYVIPAPCFRRAVSIASKPPRFMLTCAHSDTYDGVPHR